jgi:hypothetical protein
VLFQIVLRVLHIDVPLGCKFSAHPIKAAELSKHLSLVEKIVEELLRPLKMSDGLLRIGHPYEHFMEPLFGLCALSYPISC